MFLLRDGAKVLTYLVPTLCVGTRVLDALRPAACRAKLKQETTRSVEEGIPTRSVGTRKPRNGIERNGQLAQQQLFITPGLG